MKKAFGDILFTKNANSQLEFNLLRHFELYPPNFAVLMKKKENVCNVVSQDFDTDEHKEFVDDHNINIRNPLSAFNPVTNEMSQKAPLKLRLKSKSGGNLPFLQFRNPTPSFSTRCDVIYKTLLRD
jgi:hypothetical protein